MAYDSAARQLGQAVHQAREQAAQATEGRMQGRLSVNSIGCGVQILAIRGAIGNNKEMYVYT